MFDLDHFKDVNDRLGHAAGDHLLRSLAERTAPALVDAVLFARISGDEFAAIFRSQKAGILAQHSAQQLLNALAKPFEVSGCLVGASASIGIAVSGPDDCDPDDLLKNADLALYAVKEEGRGGVRLYQPALKQGYIARRMLSKDLELALASDELELNFQPIISLSTNRTISFEALLRWRHPSRGWIAPAEFIPIAEETGLILTIGRWVLDRACAAAAEWPADIDIAINLSTRQFLDPDLRASIIEALTRHNLQPARLTLGITEPALVRNDQVVLAALNTLRETGIRISLDNFGTGYASLSYLTQFPFDVIKIDRTFVRSCPEQKNNLIIVQSICDLAMKLGLSTVAEGIETQEQLANIRSVGCRNGQGYLFDRAMPATECATRLALEQLSQVSLIDTAEGRLDDYGRVSSTRR